MSSATILHADLDAFYASVEQRDHAELRGRPVIVGGGVVLSASYEARARGVRKAMGGGAARRCCPDAIVVRPRFEAYLEASRRVFEVFDAVTPDVEAISIDEAFLEVAGSRRLFGDPVEIALALRRRVRDEIGLPLSIGIASTKHCAKVASARAKPDGVLHVRAGHELDFLHPLPIGALWGVGPATASKLAAYGLRTVADVAALDADVLVGLAGGALGRRLHALSHNIDERRVVHAPRRRTVGSQQALGRRPRRDEELHAVLLALADRVARRMRDGRRLGRTLTLRVRFDDMTAATRSDTSPSPTDQTDQLYRRARALLTGWGDVLYERGVTLLGLSMSNLTDRHVLQLALPFDRDRAALDAAVDRVRGRFGRSALTAVALLNRRELSTPLGIELVEGVDPAAPGAPANVLRRGARGTEPGDSRRSAEG